MSSERCGYEIRKGKKTHISPVKRKGATGPRFRDKCSGLRTWSTVHRSVVRSFDWVGGADRTDGTLDVIPIRGVPLKPLAID